MVAKISWFNKVRSGMNNTGVVCNGVMHTGKPVMMGNKTWKKGQCPKCSSKNGFVFRSNIDPNLYILFCQKCGKYSWARVEPATPSTPTTPAVTGSDNKTRF